MLFTVLKAFGIDIPARIEELKAQVERRVEHATDQARQTMQTIAVTAALATVAALAALAAICIGLAALFHWVAENEDVYSAYGVVGGLLLAVAIILGGVIWARSRPTPAQSPARKLSELGAEAANAARLAPRPAAPVAAPAPVAEASRIAANAGGAELGKLLAFLIPLFSKSPAGAAGVVEDVLTGLRTGQRSETGEVLEGAANLVREGDRINLIAAVAGAVLFGWIMTRRSRP